MFNKPSRPRKNVRKRKVSSDDEEKVAEKSTSETIELAKLRRELTKKTAGVSAVTLAKGIKLTKEEELNDDPFKMKTGGLTVVKDRDRERTKIGENDRDVTNMSDTFKVEKKIRDEEEEMNKFIETELLKRRGIELISDGRQLASTKLEDIVDPKHLYSLPGKYRVTSKIHREDGLLSAQMLNGIPEFDLGINSKLKNIERTETAKRLMVNKFIRDEMEAKKDGTEFGQMSREATVVRGGQEFTDQFFSQHMRFYKGDEFATDAVAKVRTKTGEWITEDKVGQYGKARVAGGIHGDDKIEGAEPEDSQETDIYKRFRLSEGVDVEKSVDTTGHRI